MSYDEMMVFAGSGSPSLTARICEYLRIEQGKNETLHFSDGNTFVRILENVRRRRVYLVQSTVFPAVVSVAPLFGEAIKRIHNRESISEMFA
jgi:ribose-phosphate pyrophosphokinase